MTQDKGSTQAGAALPGNDNVVTVASRKGRKREKFPCKDLTEEQIDKLEKLVQKIKTTLRGQLPTTVETGIDLLDMKQIAGHGNFRTRVRDEFGWSERTATNYMELARHFKGKTANFADLDLGTARALVSESTPAEIRNELFKRAEDGESITREEVRKRIADSKAATRKPVPQVKKADPSDAKKVEALPSASKSPAEEVAEALLNLLSTLGKRELPCTPDEVAELLSEGENKCVCPQVHECVDFVRRVATGLSVLIPSEPAGVGELELAS